jgi:hypothetical protein
MNERYKNNIEIINQIEDCLFHTQCNIKQIRKSMLDNVLTQSDVLDIKRKISKEIASAVEMVGYIDTQFGE